jgi:hypothetical protein
MDAYLYLWNQSQETETLQEMEQAIKIYYFFGERFPAATCVGGVGVPAIVPFNGAMQVRDVHLTITNSRGFSKASI